jgi:glutamate-1-semialdehyde 2,1-aminomutase
VFLQKGNLNMDSHGPSHLDFRRSRGLQQLAHERIPGGSHTYAKGDDQYPLLSPGFISRGEGCHVWDVDGNEYIEYGMGNRCVGLGHAYRPVVEAAHRAMQQGVNFGRPSPLEVECASELLGMIAGAEMVKFAKNGSDATTGAVKLARAYTGRDLVALCKDHPFFSVDDWFIGTTPLDAGIPEESKKFTLAFRYNDLASLEALFQQYPGRIACVILEPAKNDEPQDGFLEKVQGACRSAGAVLVFDEMITGFRWHNGGAQRVYGVTPDLSCFGKAMANGFSLSALAGRRELMRLGGLDHDQARVFLLSTTHGAETHALAAGIATMQTYQREPVVETLYRQGAKLTAALCTVIREHGLSDHIQIQGRPCALVYVARDGDLHASQAFRTLLLQETIKRGILMPSLVISFSHSDDDIARTVEAWNGALDIYARALTDGVEEYLVGPPSQSVYRRFNAAG